MDKSLKKEEKEKQVEEGVCEVGEDATKYGEFISTYFAWVSLPEQKEKVKKLEDITKKDKKERKPKENKENWHTDDNKSQRKSKNTLEKIL